jgi:cysteine desulfuration protein SufE
MSTIKERANELVEDFELFGDWEDKYEYIISLGKELEAISDAEKVEENIVKGCQSQVWLVPESKEDHIVFRADSDAIITKGIIALLVKVVNDQKPADVARYEFDFIDQIGLKEHLSPNRSNGLVSMIKKMKTYAIAMANK